MATMSAKAMQGETLDALVWRILGAGSGVVEQALELNRGLADGGAILTEGQTVLLPIAAPATPAREIIQLWD